MRADGLVFKRRSLGMLEGNNGQHIDEPFTGGDTFFSDLIGLCGVGGGFRVIFLYPSQDRKEGENYAKERARQNFALRAHPPKNSVAPGAIFGRPP